ncbi:HlyD family secretion protein [Stakelama saccharophila]|uniref:HlyD family secretion protein n=1 Tax=Stakelama saccharophila TaxID=3075605 RepID=A0ABZ0BB43_9SPHN|nr:HlyD family secretion protein [Stakelama sp. W311]WNO54498.1 HlyD family secretion protein [Stakelama sp. W311]
MTDMSQSFDSESEADDHETVAVPQGEDRVADTVGPDAEAGKKRSLAKRLRRPLLILGPLVLLVGGVLFYLNGGRYVSTDNAYLNSGQVQVSANVAGRVVDVEVENNQHVKKGQVLFRLDPAPYQARVDEAEARLANARTQVRATRANYRQGQAEIQAARDKLRYAEREAARQKELLDEGISSQSQYDQAVLAVQTARQGIQTSQQRNESIEASLSGNVGAPVDQQPAVKQAEAALRQAKLDLGYTVIRAAQDGIVTKVDQLQVGDYVSASQPVFTLVGNRIWVEANFKENQLQYMRLGQPASVSVDAFPDLDLHGHVSSFSPGTGNAFSVLPAQNATGNWVKVVQRLPVEITLDRVPEGRPLHAGLSSEVTVDTGHERHLFGPDEPAAAAAK